VVTCPACGRENPDAARFCNACGTPLPAEERPLGEERKTVTVVFVDLVGFTARAEQLDPEDVRSVLAPYHARVRVELERRGGVVEKFIGDAVMAVFGAPAAHEDDPERAVRAALAIRNWSAEQSDLQVRIAVNTGEALVRVGARPAEGEAMVAGDVVNTAARMQTAAPVNGILVGESSYRATRDAIGYREAPPLVAKGKAAPVPVWEALDPIAHYGVDVSESAATPLVGRARELELLRTVLGRVRDERAAQLLTIVGVPGIGKSRLVRELLQLVDDEAQLITWRQGRCLPYGESVTFWALGEIVKAEAGILESDSPTEAAQRLSEAVVRLVPDPTETRWVEAGLRALVGVSDDGAGEADADTATAAWRRFLEAIAERGPAVLVFEDLHWADDGLLDFLDDAVDWLRGVPLLVVGTARPELLERRQGWGGGKPNATTISLQPLAEEETARLVSTLLHQPVQLADEQHALLERAGGNPLFAEQYVRMLAERGTTGELPESVHGVIAARIDALSPAEKELLQAASVHGKVFWSGGVASANEIELAEAERLFRALERKDFVRRERRSTVAGDVQYSFQHVLLRDVAYGQIPRRSRADRHRHAAGWLEGLGRPDDHAELLAHHYKQALELERAVGTVDDPALVKLACRWLQAAGERTLALSAFATAAAYFEDALALSTPDDPVRPRILLRLAQAVFLVGGAGLDMLEEALQVFRAAGDQEGVAEAATIAARFAWFAGNRSETDRLVAVALDAVADRPKSRARAEALSSQVGFLMLGGSFEEAIRVGAEALPLVETLGMEEQRARLHNVVGCSRCCLGDAAGLDEVKMSIDIAEAAGSLDQLAAGYTNLASELNFFGRLAEARQAFGRFAELVERYGLHRFARTMRAEDASWAYVDGRWDEAFSHTDEVAARVDAGETHFTDAMVLSLRGWILLARGDAAGAGIATQRAAQLAHAADLQVQAAAYPIRAAVALSDGERDEAEELASELIAMGPTMLPGLGEGFPSLTDAAWVFCNLGREHEFKEAMLDPSPIKSPWNDASRAIADGDLVRAADIVDGIGHGAAAAHAHLRAAEALAAAGDDAEAAEHRAAAEVFYRQAGATAFLQRLELAPGKSAATRKASSQGWA
jgi:class 3 adenylate cyclase/tetratricopeptide (TPR) repeat protein